MSKQDNLTDFLTDVADAIREKKGTTEKINPQNFSEEIRGIESGLSYSVIDPTGNGFIQVKTVIIKEGAEFIGVAAFKQSSITSIIIPETVLEIRESAFQELRVLGIIDIPSSVNRIDINAFIYSSKLRFVTFLNNSNVPTLSNTNAFTGTSCKFVVPDALYDEWIAATNWSTYADRIVKASEFVEPTNNE